VAVVPEVLFMPHESSRRRTLITWWRHQRPRALMHQQPAPVTTITLPLHSLQLHSPATRHDLPEITMHHSPGNRYT